MPFLADQRVLADFSVGQVREDFEQDLKLLKKLELNQQQPDQVFRDFFRFDRHFSTLDNIGGDGCSTVVEHSPHIQKVFGSNPGIKLFFFLASIVSLRCSLFCSFTEKFIFPKMTKEWKTLKSEWTIRSSLHLGLFVT